MKRSAPARHGARCAKLPVALILLLAIESCCALAGNDEVRRIVSVGGALTEIVHALGMSDRLVGVDTTSDSPPQVTKLPSVGYLRALGAEGIVALHPDVMLTAAEAGPPAALKQIRAANVRVETIAAPLTPEGAAAKIGAVAAILGATELGADLVQRYQAEWRTAQDEVASLAGRPRVLFVMAHGGSGIQVSGEGTAADAMIRLAGAVNAVSGFQGYRPLTVETVVMADPDSILLTTEGEAALGGQQALWRQPGLALTRAGQAQRAIAMEASYLLGFGPRLPQAVRELARRLHEIPS